jgi:hypothetical protein
LIQKSKPTKMCRCFGHKQCFLVELFLAVPWRPACVNSLKYKTQRGCTMIFFFQPSC